MASNSGSGASRPVSTSDFNARAKALSARLGEVAKPQESRRQNWHKSRPRPEANAPDAARAEEPETEQSDEAEAEQAAEGSPEVGDDRTA